MTFNQIFKSKNISIYVFQDLSPQIKCYALMRIRKEVKKKKVFLFLLCLQHMNVTNNEASYLSSLKPNLFCTTLDSTSVVKKIINNHSFNKYFFSVSCMPGVLLAAGASAFNRTDKTSESMEMEFQWGRQKMDDKTNQQTNN